MQTARLRSTHRSPDARLWVQERTTPARGGRHRAEKGSRLELKYTPPAQIAPCPFLEVREFELRPPDADDWEEENPTFPNALPVCTAGQPCRYATYCCPQPWHTWDTQTICCGFIVAYAGGDTIELSLTIEPEVGAWWPYVAPLQIQPEATRDEQL